MLQSDYIILMKEILWQTDTAKAQSVHILIWFGLSGVEHIDFSNFRAGFSLDCHKVGQSEDISSIMSVTGKESGRNVDFSAAPASHNAWPS